jgi:hypothetical protein
MDGRGSCSSRSKILVRGGWPRLVVTQDFYPTWSFPGVLLVEHTRQLFIGAGTRLLGYHCRSGSWSRQWTDEAQIGFWRWRRHGDVVLMSAEVELAAWTLDGRKLWSTDGVEPPWGYQVIGGEVHVDVMGTKSSFRLGIGPEA